MTRVDDTRKGSFNGKLQFQDKKEISVDGRALPYALQCNLVHCFFMPNSLTATSFTHFLIINSMTSRTPFLSQSLTKLCSQSSIVVKQSSLLSPSNLFLFFSLNICSLQKTPLKHLLGHAQEGKKKKRMMISNIDVFFTLCTLYMFCLKVLFGFRQI